MINLKNLVIGIAIIILTIFVGVYGIGVLFDEPKYEDFCSEFRTAEYIDTAERCEAVDGKWMEDGVPRKPVAVDEREVTGYCDRDFKCRGEYEDAQENYYKKVFLVALPLGVVIIVIGALVFGLESVGAGLMGGGLGIILYGVGGFWRFTEDWMKFGMSLIGLVVVIWLAYYVNKRWHGGEKKKGKKK